MTLWVTVRFFLETSEGKIFSLNVLLKTFRQWSWCFRWQCSTFSRLGKAKILEEDALLRLCFRHWVGSMILVLLYLRLFAVLIFVVVVIDVYAIRIDQQCASLVRSVDFPWQFLSSHSGWIQSLLSSWQPFKESFQRIFAKTSQMVFCAQKACVFWGEEILISAPLICKVGLYRQPKKSVEKN